MKAVKHPGHCRLCGQLKEMSAEHIPPRHAFNSTTVKVLPYNDVLLSTCGEDDRMPWDIQGLNGSLQQGGYKKYCLCHACNNNTGQWYMRSYTDLAKTIHQMIKNEGLSVGSSYSFAIKDIYPLRVYKAMMTLICDVNYDCFGDESLRQFLLSKTDKRINISKYSLYMFLVSAQMPRICGLSAKANIYHPENTVYVSEIASYPIGFALYIDKPKNYSPFGLNVDAFASFDYDEKCEIKFIGMPYLDINSQFPADYRSKKDIIECIKSAEQLTED